MSALRIAIAGLVAMSWCAATALAQSSDELDTARINMVRVIQLQARLTRDLTGIDEIDPRVLEAMSKVPRHHFVPEPLAQFAYVDRPLPLGYGQNISQPFIIALMTHILGLDKEDVVFETGTGAGYHAALLAELAGPIYSVEVVQPLAEVAAERLHELGYDNVTTKAGDGYFGWERYGPYDAILLKEAVDHVPPPLLAQLKPGGRMVLPLGPLNGPQFLTLVEKGENGEVNETRVLEVLFAPLQGGDRI